MPQPPARAFSQKDLPPSVESAYYRKCIDLRRRINDIEENNDATRLRITRLNRGIQKMRLERVFLLEQLNKHMEHNVDDSDRSSSPPPTPTDKPLRSKRSHNRKGTPPPGGAQGESVGPTGAGGSGGVAGGSAIQHQSPGSVQHAPLLHAHQPINPLSSAQSTPDPSRQTSSYFGSLGASAASPHGAVNGAAVLPPLPALHSLPPLQQTAPPPRAAYFDPAYDDTRPAPVEPEPEAGRRRAYSGAQAPQGETAPQPPQNGDTEMTDAFTGPNR